MRRRIHPNTTATRDPKFFLSVTSAEPHKILQKALADLIRDLNCQRIKQNCCLQDFNIGTFWTTLKVTAFCFQQKGSE
jgi:hypothetical protein